MVTHSTNILVPNPFLKIIPIKVEGPLGEKELIALLDEAADGSLIDKSLAKSFQGRPLHTVGPKCG